MDECFVDIHFDCVCYFLIVNIDPIDLIHIVEAGSGCTPALFKFPSHMSWISVAKWLTLKHFCLRVCSSSALKCNIENLATLFSLNLFHTQTSPLNLSSFSAHPSLLTLLNFSVTLPAEATALTFFFLYASCCSLAVSFFFWLIFLLPHHIIGETELLWFTQEYRGGSGQFIPNLRAFLSVFFWWALTLFIQLDADISSPSHSSLDVSLIDSFILYPPHFQTIFITFFWFNSNVNSVAPQVFFLFSIFFIIFALVSIFYIERCPWNTQFKIWQFFRQLSV